MRKVYFSFHYDNDINRAMVVSNSWVTKDKGDANRFIDKAELEKVKLEGKEAIYRWINNQLSGTSVTAVLIGRETLNRPFVQYEIYQSLRKGNGIIGIYIHKIRDMNTKQTTERGNVSTIIRFFDDGKQVCFKDICDDLYDWETDDGYSNLGSWIECSARKHGK